MGIQMPSDQSESRLDADTRACLAAVADFAEAEIRRRWPRPEQTLSATDFAAIVHAAQAAGLLDATADGAGLWSDLARSADPAFSLQALRCLARQHTGVAFHLHGLALAQAAAGMLGQKVEATLPLTFTTTWGLGRSALARWLSGAPLAENDTPLLEDLFGDGARILFAPASTGGLLPRFQSGQLHLACYPPASGTAIPDAQPHGLDGLMAFTWRPDRPPLWSAALTPASAATLLAAFLSGLVAIALGASERAAHLAADYATCRIQGGRPIIQHDAVALLMAEVEDGLHAAAARLLPLGPLTAPDSLALAIGLKRELLPLLCASVNAAMQIHGGCGYMRDTGVENVLRDLNCLRVIGGSPDELGLMRTSLQFPTAAQPEALCPGQPLPGYVAADSALAPLKAFRQNPVLRLLASYRPALSWQRDSDTLPGPLRAYRQQLRDFAEAHLQPLALPLDLHMKTARIRPPALDNLLVQAGRAGLLSDLLPRPLGSAPVARYRFSLAWQQAMRCEELARVDGGLMLLLSAHNLGLAPVLFSGNLHVYHRVLLPALRACEAGEPQIFAFAITEPGAGSDAEDGHGAERNRPGLVATAVPGGWRLRGRKVFISGGDVARWVVTFAALAGEGFESWTAFLVDTTGPGFNPVRNEHKMGMRASAATELEFDDYFVPDARVLGGVRKGWALNRATLNFSRMPVAGMAVGFAQRATELATDFACQTTVAGRPLLHFQQVQLALADMQAETAAIRALVWRFAQAWTPWQAKASLAKFYATDQAQKVIERGMNLLGEPGLLHAREMEKLFRDNRLTRIFEGTNQINRLAVIEDQQSLLLEKIKAPRR